jgi:CRP-like cAMP-binding protein
MRQLSCETCPIRSESIIADLPVDKLADFRACGTTLIYKRRQVIFHEGTPATGLYVLCHGAVKLFQSDRFGRDYILDVAKPGDILGELPPDASEPYSVSAEALTDSQVCYLPRERLVPFIQVHPMTGVRLIAALSSALSSTRRKASGLVLKPAESRLAVLLVQLVRSGNEPEGGPERVTLPYSRREIAEMIGVSTETAIRLLGRLKKKSVIEIEGRKLVITDIDKLARLASHASIANSTA